MKSKYLHTLEQRLSESCQREERCRTKNEKLQAELDNKCVELQEAKQDLLEFGRHSEGCNYPYGKEYGCKCGWLQVEQALKGGE